MKGIGYAMAYVLCAVMFVGCAANQSVEWTKAKPLDYDRGAKVCVTAACIMPNSEIAYLETDIQENVDKVLTGNSHDASPYRITIEVTRYDEGNSFGRFMLIGLGQMYLYGTVKVEEGEPPVVVRQGSFKKNYCVGGLIGGFASMQNNVLPKVGPDIAEALQEDGQYAHDRMWEENWPKLEKGMTMHEVHRLLPGSFLFHPDEMVASSGRVAVKGARATFVFESNSLVSWQRN